MFYSTSKLEDVSSNEMIQGLGQSPAVQAVVSGRLNVIMASLGVSPRLQESIGTVLLGLSRAGQLIKSLGFKYCTFVSHVQYFSFPLQIILCILACDVLTAMTWMPQQPIPLCHATAVGYSTLIFSCDHNIQYLTIPHPPLSGCA